jgi:hypothetical protein
MLLTVLMTDKFKYGLSGKGWSIRKKRIILSGGNRRDIEQIGKFDHDK